MGLKLALSQMTQVEKDAFLFAALMKIFSREHSKEKGVTRQPKPQDTFDVCVRVCGFAPFVNVQIKGKAIKRLGGGGTGKSKTKTKPKPMPDSLGRRNTFR